MKDETQALSRRGFVKTGALATATAATFSVLPSKDARAAAPLSIGLVGCGGRGRGAALNAMSASKNVKITAIADIFQDRIDKAREEFKDKLELEIPGDRCYLGWDAYKKLLATDIDYVILATPPVFRPMMLTAAVKANKHIFMEKPAAVDAPGIREVMAAGKKAKKLGLCIAAGTQRRHRNVRIEVVQRVRDGAIGDIVAARAYWCGGPIGFYERTPGMSEMEYQIRSWYHYLWLSGDHIVEQHVHNLDMINWAMGEHPVEAFGHGGRAWQEKGNIWDHHTVDYVFGNGVHLNSMCRQSANGVDNVSEFVVGTKGSSNLNNWIGGGQANEWNFEGKPDDPYVQEHAHLMASIRGGNYINEAQNVAESTMTAIMGRMAEYSGKRLTWDEALASEERLADPLPRELGQKKLQPVAVPGGKPYAGEGWMPG